MGSRGVPRYSADDRAVRWLDGTDGVSPERMLDSNVSRDTGAALAATKIEENVTVTTLRHTYAATRIPSLPTYVRHGVPKELE